MHSSFKQVSLLYNNNLLWRQRAYLDEVHTRGGYIKTSLSATIYLKTKHLP